ncbi:DUF1697 domain-containing protein [Candidatus Gracilibacteria bacterium]|nr:MAG: DUF1697 domain-containing protein [Candidatus Gracilibacteria bacterium]
MNTKSELKPYIVLLRGVMPTGKNRIPKMSVLQEILLSEFDNVRTYIQSGNIVLTSNKSPGEITNKVSELIKLHIGAELSSIVTTKEKVKEMLNKNPFGADYNIGRIFFTLTNDTLSPELVDKISKEKFESEELRIVEDKLYMYLPKDASRTKLNNNYLEKRLKIVATTRNFNTLQKLLDIIDQLPPLN